MDGWVTEGWQLLEMFISVRWGGDWIQSVAHCRCEKFMRFYKFFNHNLTT